MLAGAAIRLAEVVQERRALFRFVRLFIFGGSFVEVAEVVRKSAATKMLHRDA